MKMAMVRTKGIITSDRLRRCLMGTLDNKIKMLITIPYNAKAKIELGWVKTTKRIKKRRPIILILGSSR
jgi:hypothetical protein